MNDLKPGWQTTEAWLTLAKVIMGVLVTTGVISANDAQTLGGALAGCITAVAALATSAYVIGHYIQGRTATKIVDMGGVDQSSLMALAGRTTTTTVSENKP